MDLKMHAQSSHDDGDPIMKGKMPHSSSSSSSSDSYFNPLLDSDDEKDILDNSITNYQGNNHSSRREQVIKSPEVSAQIPEWSMIDASPKQSPPLQTMGQSSAGYDPNRIPASIFSSKPSTPTEWSVASNESLFSIHMGNNSFSKDNAILMEKSGELNRLDDFCNFTSTQQNATRAKSTESNSSPSGLPTVLEVAAENQRNSVSTSEESGVKEAAGNKEVPSTDGARNSASTPRLSDVSANSSRSFAFQVLTGEGGRSGTVRVAPDNFQSNPPIKQQLQPQAMVEPPPKAAETRWYSCLCCCPPCC
ncbi:hypothetical protein U1Q18_012249 [Sarracenia purpurea var. burkii]